MAGTYIESDFRLFRLNTFGLKNFSRFLEVSAICSNNGKGALSILW